MALIDDVGSIPRFSITAEQVQTHWCWPGSENSCEFPEPVKSETEVARGIVWHREIAPGLLAVRSQIEIFADFNLKETHEPCLMLGVILNGCAQIRVGPQAYKLELGELGVLRFGARETTTGIMERDARMDLAGVVARPDWLARNSVDDAIAQSGILTAIAQRKIELSRCPVTPALHQSALNLFQLNDDAGPISRLRSEAAAMQFFADAVIALNIPRVPGNERILTPREFKRIQDVRERLETCSPEDDVTLENVAREAGMSVSTLCRHFKMAFDTSVIAYVSKRRMDTARSALVEEGLTVGQAAHIAGYSSPANFSTAFRREFGITPTQARSRM